ncbi:MAG: hypothetical protein WCF24_05360, partial [Acidimicrobiales bacterium]
AVRRAVRGAERLAGTLARDRHLAELFCELATLRVDQTLLKDVASLRWQGPTTEFEEIWRKFRDPSLAKRAAALASG